MSGLLRFMRARLHRVIFAMLMLSTVVTFSVVIGGYMTYQAAGFPTHFSQQHDRAAAYFSSRFERVWDDRVARNEELDALNQHLGFSATLYDADGSVLRDAVCECTHGSFRFDLTRVSGEHFGALQLCNPQVGPKRPMLLGLLLVLAALLVGSAFVAQRIARPLRTLRDTAHRFGDGELSARADLGLAENEIGEVARSFNEMADRIEQQFEDNNALLAEVSHELRTPLGHLKMLVELLRAGGEPTKHLAGVEREVDAIDMLMEQLLAKSRLAFELTEMRSLSVPELAIQALERTGTPYEVLEVGDGVGSIEGDPNLLAAALSNLLRNGEEHGGGITRVRIERRGDEVVFMVEDSGPGLDETAHERLFQPFVKGKNGHDGGLGLGLALVRRIVEAHGGTMIVVSDEGGTHIGFALPA